MVPLDELPILKAQIQTRKEIESQIRGLQSKEVTLSKNANELTGSVMNGNTEVARFEKGVLVSIDEHLAPLSIIKTHSLEQFLKLRVMDMSRTNARILRKVLHLDTDEDYKASLYAYALSISDRYWFKPKHSKLKYEDLPLEDDSLFETSLKGEVNVFFHKARLSPEITTTGSFEKGWRYIDHQWYLYKSGNPKQFFSELFCSRFASLLGIPTVIYEMDDGYIRCLNFSPELNFEPIAALAGSKDDYDYIFPILYNISRDIAKQYLRLIFFDTVMNNIDRHNENCGLMRDPRSGAILSLAPNFDNNLALIATCDRLNDRPEKDGFIQLFVRFIQGNEIARLLLKDIQWKDIDIDDLRHIVQDIVIDIGDMDQLLEAVLIRYEYLKNRF